MDKRQQLAIETFISDRTPRPLMGSVLAFDLAEEVRKLTGEAGWQVHRHNARTLIKHTEFRLVLIILAAGERIDEQMVDERVCIQTLQGSLRIHTADDVVHLGPGGLIALDRKVSFGIEASERSDLLLWVGWSPG